MVVALIARGQPVEDVYRLCRSRLLHLHPAKAALQRGILLDVCAEFLIGGGTDELDFAAGQHRLEDAGRINGTLRRTSPHDGVEFVHKEDGGAVPHQLLQQVLEALFKIARYLVPATRLAISSASSRLPCKARGTCPFAMRWASPSANAVLPTPGSPTRQGLFFWRRHRISTIRSSSASRQNTGSSSPSSARRVRSRQYLSLARPARGMLADTRG